MPTPRIRSGASMSSTDIFLYPNISNRHVPWPNICNRSWYQSNNSFPPAKISSLAPQLIPADFSLHQQLMGYLSSVRDQPPLSPDAKTPHNFTNRRRGRPNYLQPAWRLSEISSTNSWAFIPASWILWYCLKYWLPDSPTYSLEALFIWLIKILLCLFLWLFGLCTLFR